MIWDTQCAYPLSMKFVQWSSFLEGDEGSYLSISHINLDVVHSALSVYFINIQLTTWADMSLHLILPMSSMFEQFWQTDCVPSCLLQMCKFLSIKKLCRVMTSRVAQMMAPLLPGIRTGVGNNGPEIGGGGAPKPPPPELPPSNNN